MSKRYAFFKRSERPWTQEDMDKILDFVGVPRGKTIHDDDLTRTYLYLGNIGRYNVWSSQLPSQEKHIDKFTIMAFEDISTITTFKTFKIKEYK